jgi:hypothetical protein
MASGRLLADCWRLHVAACPVTCPGPGQQVCNIRGETCECCNVGQHAYVHAGGDAPDLQEFLEAVEKHRQQVVDQLVKTYRTIGPLLGKVEEAVAGTNTGRQFCAGQAGCGACFATFAMQADRHTQHSHRQQQQSNKCCNAGSFNLIPCPWCMMHCRQGRAAGALLRLLGACHLRCTQHHGAGRAAEAAAPHGGRQARARR